MGSSPLLSINIGEFYGEQLEEVLPLVYALGISYVELPIPMIMERGLEETRKLLKEFKLSVSAVNSWSKLASESPYDKEALEASINSARVLETNLVVVYFGDGDMHNFKMNIAPYLDNGDITFLLENEFSSLATKEAEACKFILEEIGSPRLLLNFDPANFYIGGEEPFPYSFELLRKHIGYVHLKDVRKVGKAKYEEQGEFCMLEGKKIFIGGKGKKVGYLAVPLGEGAINYEGLLRALGEMEYRGFITLEIHTEKERREETLKRSLEYLRRHLI